MRALVIKRKWSKMGKKKEKRTHRCVHYMAETNNSSRGQDQKEVKWNRGLQRLNLHLIFPHANASFKWFSLTFLSLFLSTTCSLSKNVPGTPWSSHRSPQLLLHTDTNTQTPTKPTEMHNCQASSIETGTFKKPLTGWTSCLRGFYRIPRKHTDI